MVWPPSLEQVAQRDNEINILVGMLKRREAGGKGGPVLAFPTAGLPSGAAVAAGALGSGGGGAAAPDSVSSSWAAASPGMRPAGSLPGAGGGAALTPQKCTPLRRPLPPSTPPTHPPTPQSPTPTTHSSTHGLKAIPLPHRDTFHHA